MVYISDTVKDQEILKHIAKQLEALLNSQASRGEHYYVSKKEPSVLFPESYSISITRKSVQPEQKWWYDCGELKLRKDRHLLASQLVTRNISFLTKELKYYFD
ncbi:hypothetical protein BCR24_06490 [Enterococcus ureilyticus]|uniref:Uncharacterized protein n=1 Tax=Enterococcus ureilyticus TaxID=1131292 RepID=A0A1E5H988_9ENTE|nr:hypothetical protein [Enterococcus ureilyticus]MBM7688414.1 hypothetical protein [Enterococcus ureilyticus]OEG21517.1 hypothetical protein BCR24_06490 [Enterococcus ureilyticus]